MEFSLEYFKKDNILSKIDARVKLITTLIILAMVLSYRGFVFPLLLLSLCLIVSIIIKIPIRVFFLRLSEPLFIAFVLVMIKFFFSGSDVLFSVKLLSIEINGYRDGLIEGLLISCRIIGAVSVIAMLGFTTPFTEFMASLSWLRIPKTFVEILMYAHRYIFVLLEDALVIYRSQKNRLGYSSLRRGLSSFGTLTGSLILRAFEQSQNITTAMIQRGYDGNMPMLKHRQFSPSEIIASGVVIIIMGFIWRA